MNNITIAIDGPAGAGKSTIAKAVSRELGIIYLDTGAMYRTVALKAMREGVDYRDGESLAKLVSNMNIRIEFEKDGQKIFLEGEDVTDQIRTPEISMGASQVSAVPAVRLKMVELQREIAAGDSVVMDGRDIGTFVLPGATLKIFLTATIEERAARRYKELAGKGTAQSDLEEVRRDMESRDLQDSTRAFAPLKKAEDAVQIDTTGMGIQKVADEIISLIKGKL